MHMENEYSMHNMTIPLSFVYYVLCIAYATSNIDKRVKVLRERGISDTCQKHISYVVEVSFYEYLR